MHIILNNVSGYVNIHNNEWTKRNKTYIIWYNLSFRSALELMNKCSVYLRASGVQLINWTNKDSLPVEDPLSPAVVIYYIHHNDFTRLNWNRYHNYFCLHCQNTEERKFKPEIICNVLILINVLYASIFIII